jgi:hypothetical protein
MTTGPSAKVSHPQNSKSEARCKSAEQRAVRAQDKALEALAEAQSESA